MSDDASRTRTPMNVIGWILVVAGAVALLASIAGVFCIFSRPTAAQMLAESASDLYLHDTYYVISRPAYAIWPFLLCMALATAISIVGYMQTDHFTRRIMPMETSSNKPGI